MSASRKKQERKNSLAEVRQEPKQSAMPKAVKWLIGIAVTLAAVAVIVFSALLGTTYFTSRTTALTVGTHSVTPAEYNIFYRMLYNDAAQQYGNSASTLMPYLTDQLKRETEDRIRQVYAIYDAAVAEGYTMSEDGKKDLDAEIEEYASFKEMFGAKTTNQVLEMFLGAGVTEPIYRHYREVYDVIGQYGDAKDAAFVKTDEELMAYYNEHADEYDRVTFRQFAVPADSQTIEEAEQIAQKVALDAKADEDSFGQNASLYASDDLKSFYAENPDQTLLEGVPLSNVADDVRAWLSAPERVYGDTASIRNSENTAVYVLYFRDRNRNTDSVVSFRDLLVSVDPESEESAWEEARTKVASYLDEFNNTGKTEEDFIKLVTDHSEGDTANGGLRENVAPSDELYPAFLPFVAEGAARDPVFARGSDGWHLLYFINFGEQYNLYLAKTTLTAEYENEWIGELVEKVTVKPNSFGMKFIQTDLTVSQQ